MRPGLTLLTASLLLAGGAPAIGAQKAPADLPATLDAGTWPSGHVQGIAVDRAGGFVYLSFTDMLVKLDLTGRVVGTLAGWSGHLGDLAFNPADGLIYGSLEYGEAQTYYIAVIDGTAIDRMGMAATDTGLLQAVALPEVTRDFAAPGHRYGCSGIDGVAVGPAFGRMDGPALLTVAYGIFGDPERADNDHQVLLQYDVASLAAHARVLDEAALHHGGPERPVAKVFVRTGNTRYGVQNLAYDPAGQRWLMGVYAGSKLDWPNYTLFAVEAKARPAIGDLVGVPGQDGAWEQGPLLPLAPEGQQHAPSGIRGWHAKADVGIEPIGDGLFYLARNLGTRKWQSAELSLQRWTGDALGPFVQVD
jgi:hypothetical protein